MDDLHGQETSSQPDLTAVHCGDTGPIRIAVVYRDQPLLSIRHYDMSTIRWMRISSALSDSGFLVDMIVNSDHGVQELAPGLRYVPYSRVDWARYDIVKTLFHTGFDALREYGGSSHPFVISKLGSVVGSHDDEEGVHFFGEERERLYETQIEIAKTSRYVTLLTEASRDLWAKTHSGSGEVLMVPTGVDRNVPPAARNPYRDFPEKIAVFIGNFYTDKQQEVNRLWQTKLNELGRLLRKAGIRVVVVGRGDSHLLDPGCITYLGPVDHSRIWDYQYHANVGLVLAQGDVQHNESSKIYYYLRTGLPIVSERPVPNNQLVEQAGLGFIAEFGDSVMMSHMVEEAANRSWNRHSARELMVNHHTWDHRVETYRNLIGREFSRTR